MTSARDVKRDLRRHEIERAADETAASFVPGSAMVGWCDGGEWAACFGLSLHNLFMYDAFAPEPRIMRPERVVAGERYYLRDLAGSMGIATARNNIARAFLDETDSEWLFMVDADMGFEADTVNRLIASAQAGGFEVMGALAFALKRRLLRPNPLNIELSRLCPTLYTFAELENEVGFAPMFDYPANSVVEVGGTGAACLVINRSVLARIRAYDGGVGKWFEPITHPKGDHGKPRTFSEDFSFCVRVAAVGGKLGVDTSVKTGHAKGGIFLTEEQYAIQRAVDEGMKVAEEEQRAQAWREGNPALAPNVSRETEIISRQNGKSSRLADVG